MKSITIVTPCFNEEANVRELYERVRSVMCTIGRYKYEHIFIDNASRDRTVPILKEIAAADHNVKIIANARNFGHIRFEIFKAGGAQNVERFEHHLACVDPAQPVEQFFVKRLHPHGNPVHAEVAEQFCLVG